MTCIVGVRTSNGVVIGADSLGSAGNDGTVRSDAKVFRNGQYIIGATHSFRMMQLLQYEWEPPKYTSGDVHPFMVKKVVQSIRQLFKDHGFMTFRNGEEIGGQFLISLAGHLFEIASDFQVGENADGVAALGCGFAYALGALYASQHLSGVDAVTRALQAAEAYSNGVAGPFNIYKEHHIPAKADFVSVRGRA